MRVLKEKRQSSGQGVSISSYFQKVPSQTSSLTSLQSYSYEAVKSQSTRDQKSHVTQSTDVSQKSLSGNDKNQSVGSLPLTPPSEGRRNKIKSMYVKLINCKHITFWLYIWNWPPAHLQLFQNCNQGRSWRCLICLILYLNSRNNPFKRMRTLCFVLITHTGTRMPLIVIAVWAILLYLCTLAYGHRIIMPKSGFELILHCMTANITALCY